MSKMGEQTRFVDVRRHSLHFNTSPANVMHRDAWRASDFSNTTVTRTIVKTKLRALDSSSSHFSHISLFAQLHQPALITQLSTH